MLLSNQIGRLVDLYHVKLAWYKREIKEKKITAEANSKKALSSLYDRQDFIKTNVACTNRVYLGP